MQRWIHGQAKEIRMFHSILLISAMYKYQYTTYSVYTYIDMQHNKIYVHPHTNQSKSFSDYTFIAYC